jgi:hypothetical protein
MTTCPFNTYEPWFANTGGQFAFSTSVDVNNYAAFRAGIPGLPSNPPQAQGDFTVVATPEPGTVGLMLIGLGLVFVTRKRIA